MTIFKQAYCITTEFFHGWDWDGGSGLVWRQDQGWDWRLRWDRTWGWTEGDTEYETETDAKPKG